MILPAWVILIPHYEDPDYLNYLINQASKDGIPDHVRKRLIEKHMERISNGNSNQG